jgi:hypothetical protein
MLNDRMDGKMLKAILTIVFLIFGQISLADPFIVIENKLEWECKEGHRWFQKPDQIENTGAWCKRCATKSAWINRKSKIT